MKAAYRMGRRARVGRIVPRKCRAGKCKSMLPHKKLFDCRAIHLYIAHAKGGDRRHGSEESEEDDEEESRQESQEVAVIARRSVALTPAQLVATEHSPRA
jgi:hypothetical protein